jgi:hypothetical protein
MRVPFPRLCSLPGARQAVTCPYGAIPHPAARRRDWVRGLGSNGARPQAYDLPVSAT